MPAAEGDQRRAIDDGPHQRCNQEQRQFNVSVGVDDQLANSQNQRTIEARIETVHRYSETAEPAQPADETQTDKDIDAAKSISWQQLQ